MHPIWWEWCQLTSSRRLRTERGTIRDISWLRGPPCGGLPHKKEGVQRRAHQPFLMQCHHRINQGRQGRINQGQLLPSWDRAPHHHCFQVGSSNALEQALDGWSNKWIMSDGPCPRWRPGWIMQKHSQLMKTAQDRGSTRDFLDTAPGLRRQWSSEASNTQLKWVYSDDGLIGPHLCQIRVALTCMIIFIGSLPPFFSLRPGLKWVRHSTSATNGTYRWWYRYPSTICIAFQLFPCRNQERWLTCLAKGFSLNPISCDEGGSIEASFDRLHAFSSSASFPLLPLYSGPCNHQSWVESHLHLIKQEHTC